MTYKIVGGADIYALLGIHFVNYQYNRIKDIIYVDYSEYFPEKILRRHTSLNTVDKFPVPTLLYVGNWVTNPYRVFVEESMANTIGGAIAARYVQMVKGKKAIKIDYNRTFYNMSESDKTRLENRLMRKVKEYQSYNLPKRFEALFPGVKDVKIEKSRVDTEAKTPVYRYIIRFIK